jgi:hypothetical protein
MDYIKKQIEFAKNNNALLILYMEDFSSDAKYNREEKIEHFIEIVSYLINNGFDFKTLEEIMVQAEIPAGSMTLGNYIKNHILKLLLD